MKKRNVPWWIWLAVGAASLVVIAMLVKEELPEVYVVGGGAIAQIGPVDAPEGVRFRVRASSEETIERTAARVEKVLGLWPASLVLGFDTSALSVENGDLPAAQAAVRDLVAMAAHTSTRLYSIGFMPSPHATPEAIAAASVMNAWWRVEICADPKIHCVEPPPFSDDPEESRRMVRTAIERALAGDRLVPGDLSGPPSS
jgi:hypothetical protein